MGLYEGFSAVGSSVTNIPALSAWAFSVSQAVDAGVPTDDAFGLLKATGVPLSSPLGKWMEQISETAEATPPSGGVGIFDSLRACQRQLSSPFGRWAQELSRAMS